MPKFSTISAREARMNAGAHVALAERALNLSQACGIWRRYCPSTSFPPMLLCMSFSGWPLEKRS